VVQIAHVLLQVTLFGVGVVLVGTVLLIFDVVVDRRTALIAAGATLIVLVIIAVLPSLVSRAGSTQVLDVKERSRGPSH